MDRPRVRASEKKRKAGEAPEIPVEANKKTKLYKINRSSPDTISDNDAFQEDDTAAITTTGHKIARVPNAKKAAPKAKINSSKTTPNNSKVTTKSAGIDAERVAEAITSKQASNPMKALKRKSTGGGSDEKLEFALPAKKAKVGQSPKGGTTGEAVEKVRNVGEVHEIPEAKETPGKYDVIFDPKREAQVNTTPQGKKAGQPARTKALRDNAETERVKDTAGVTKAIIADNSSETSDSESETEITAPDGPNIVGVYKYKTALSADREKPTPGKVASNTGIKIVRSRVASMYKALDKESIDVVENAVRDVVMSKASGAKGFQQNGNDGTSSQGSRFRKAKERSITNAIEGERNQVKGKAKVPLKGPQNRKVSEGETSTKDIVEIDKDHETPSSWKAKNNTTTTSKPIAALTSQEEGDTLGRGVARYISEDLPDIISVASSRDGRAGRSTSIQQISEVEPSRNPFIVTDPNKPRPRGLGRPHFEETPAYKKLMEVATQVKRAARILTKKLISAKAVSKNSSAEEQQKVVVGACEKVEKFVKIYSPQIKFLNAEEYTTLLKAAVQCLGDTETAELPNHDFQKVLCTFLEGMNLSESQAITVGLYPILEVYKMEEELGELSPEVKQLIASINASLVKKSKAAEARLVNPDYLPEDYLTRMQKRVLAMGNISKPIFDDWERFLKDSAPLKAIQRAQPLSLVDQVVAVYQPVPPTIKPKPTRAKSDWEKNHIVSKLISRNRSNKRLETKIRNTYKVVREHKTYEVEQDDGEPMVYRSCRRPVRFDETKEARQILEYDAFGKPIWPDDAEEAGGPMVRGSFGNTLEFD